MTRAVEAAKKAEAEAEWAARAGHGQYPTPRLKVIEAKAKMKVAEAVH